MRYLNLFLSVVSLVGCDRQTTVRQSATAAKVQVASQSSLAPARLPSAPVSASFAGGNSQDGGYIPGDSGSGIGRDGGRIPTIAHLVLSPDHFNFQVQSLDSYTHQAITVTNTGESYATDMAAGGLAEPFSFKAGSYPGDGGTCGSSLAPGASCRLLLTFHPRAVGRVTQNSFWMRYSEGELALPLEGSGTAIATLKLVNLIDEQTDYDFGTIPFGGTLNHVFRLKYYGASAATGVSFSSVSGPFSIVWNQCPAEITADCDLAIRYTGTVNGRAAQRVKVTYDNSAFAATTFQDLSGTTSAEITEAVLQVADVNFDRRLVGTTAQATVTVRKGGSRPATNVHALPLTAAFDFVGGYYPGIGGTCGATIAADCLLVVTFSPTAAIPYADSLRLAYTREDGAHEAVGFLSGRGAVPASLTVTPVTVRDFGTIPVGRPADRHFTVANTDAGMVAMEFSAGGTEAPFRLLGDCGTTLSPGSSCTLTVRFTPTEAVAARGQITIVYFDGVSNQTVTEPFTGDGGTLADIQFTQTSVDFGDITVGTQQLIELNVEYYGVLTGGHCTIGGIAGGGGPGGPGGGTGGFEFPGGNYPGGGTCSHDIHSPCTIRLTFIPQEVRTYSTVLTLYYEDGSGSVKTTTVTLHGQGLGTAPSQIGFEKPVLDFGDVIVNAQKSLTVNVLRTGDLAATSLALTGLGNGLTFLGGTSPGSGGTCGSLLNTDSCNYVLSYAPNATGELGPRNVTLSFNDGQALRSSTFVVTGRGYDAAHLTASALDLGKVAVGSDSTKVITVTNSGTAPSAGLRFTASVSDPYSIDSNNCGAILAPGASCQVKIKFAPIRPGVQSASLGWQYENGRETAALSVAITGSGTVPFLVSAGGHHTCARVADGSVKCWGHNLYGQLGVGDATHRLAPTTAVNLGTGRYAKAIAVGFWHSCALLDDDSVKCWGSNSYGQLGRQNADATAGTRVADLGDNLPAVDLGGRTVKEIAAGYSHTCARFSDGNVACWGFNGQGQLGLGDTVNRGQTAGTLGRDLRSVDLNGLAAVSLGASTGNTCALGSDGALKCWGNNFYGQLGMGDFVNRGEAPDQLGNHLPAIDLGTSPVRAVAAGGAFVCALQDSGRVKCWGRNETAVLGTLWCQDYDGNLGPCSDSYYALPLRGYGLRSGLMGDHLAAVELSSSQRAVALAAGNGSACARFENGELKCWGENGNGQLGLGDSLPRGRTALEMGNRLPAVALGGSVDSFSVGSNHACAVLDTGVVKCWGGNRYGELGVGDTENRGDAANEMGMRLPAIGL